MKLLHFGIKFMPPSIKFMRLAVCFFFLVCFFFFPQVRKSCTCEVHDLRSHNAQCKKMLLYVIILFRYGFHALRMASGMVFMLFANLSGMVFMLLRLGVFIPKYN